MFSYIRVFVGKKHFHRGIPVPRIFLVFLQNGKCDHKLSNWNHSIHTKTEESVLIGGFRAENISRLWIHRHIDDCTIALAPEIHASALMVRLNKFSGFFFQNPRFDGQFAWFKCTNKLIPGSITPILTYRRRNFQTTWLVCGVWKSQLQFYFFTDEQINTIPWSFHGISSTQRRKIMAVFKNGRGVISPFKNEVQQVGGPSFGTYS